MPLCRPLLAPPGRDAHINTLRRAASAPCGVLVRNGAQRLQRRAAALVAQRAQLQREQRGVGLHRRGLVQHLRALIARARMPPVCGASGTQRCCASRVPAAPLHQPITTPSNTHTHTCTP
jgi:hypothetical protein